jgi:16S rRNA (guanine527-N7)-methyltransferase
MAAQFHYTQSPPMSELSTKRIAELLKPYGVDASPKLCEQVQSYVDLLLDWNRRMALTAITDPAEIVRFHFGESMFAASAVPIRNGRLADIGSGPGFPSIPLSMVSTEITSVPIESNSKKSTFQSEVARRLILSNVHPYRGRMEDFPENDANFDWVAARALGDFPALLAWSARATGPTGRLALWVGANDAAELLKNQSWIWSEPIRIPESDRRLILIGSRAL